MNALKHGATSASLLLPGEDPAQYQRLVSEYHRDIRPDGALEQFQVDTLIRADWQRRRLQRIEADLYRQLFAEGVDPEQLDVSLLRDSPTGKLLLKIWGQIAAHERAHLRALSEIRRLRRERDQNDMQFIEEALAMPELPAVIQAERDRRLARNEPNSGPKPVPARDSDNPALRL
ncbi:MAG TPA: hypothetical protein VKE70_27490 [Candidatus Solibacter sp.]|nr:hypothetical protein [Candidatus Solibacter sp.]